ncbi:lycopene cyclase family protein [uncultured Salinisphaera sp.]|uniref:lycopene cyclase family protein n=1 Tax=uncultured Salinisphaera sp. TaxID=359372 RepID=UPI0032B1A943
MTAHTQPLDLVILGGGLAGLTLCEALAGRGLSVLVLEARPEYITDRTWSFWSADGEPAPWPGEQGRWNRWQVRHGERAPVACGAPGWQYVSLDAGAWLNAQAQRIAADPDQRLAMGREVIDMDVTDAGVRVRLRSARHSDAIETIEARQVVDARLNWRRAPAPSYAQHFLGYEVETNRPAFDGGVAGLMEFRPGAMAGEGVDFVYLLPFTDRRALIEVTRFSAVAPPQASLKAWLGAELRQRCGARPVRVFRSETASLPMTVTAPKRSPHPGRYLAIGQGAGVNRGATGYAFRRIRRQCQQLVDDLCRQGRLPDIAPDPGGPIERGMDRLFLRVIRRRPDLAPRLFADLFAGCPPARLVRFLDDSPSLVDRIAVITACARPAFAAGLLGPK